MNRTQRAAAVLAVLFAAAHLPLLPQSLEDVDSINFALGIRDYNVAQHQPHPPGYPLYIGAAKLLNTVAGVEVVTLALLSVIGGALGVVALVALYGALAGDARDRATRSLAAAGIAATAPLYWFTAARPLSDVPGLAAAAAIQALIVSAASPGRLAAAAAIAGLSAGIRSQMVWLTVPLLVLQWLRRPADERGAAAWRVAVAYAAGVLVWAVPLLIVSGGPTAYWAALVDQGAEDLSGVTMLWTEPTPRQFALALRNTFVLPWSHAAIATVVIGFAVVGTVSFVRSGRGREVLLTLAAGYGPYYLFDLFFQETVTTRYALPLVVPVAFAAVEGARAVSGRMPALLAAGLAIVNVAAGTYALIGYSREPAPAFRLLSDMRAVDRIAGDQGDSRVLGMHRRASFDMRRPMQWVGSDLPAFSQRLASPPKKEWLELVEYWNAGGRAPVWFIADPLRSDLALIDRPAPVRYRWPFDPAALLGGVRPNQMDWYRLEPPAWYLGEGWSVTPETAGVAREDRKGPGAAPIHGWLRRQPRPLNLMYGGRNISGSPAHIQVTVDGKVVDSSAVAPGFFVRMLSFSTLAASGADDYATLSISASSEEVAIEQFSAKPAGEVLFGFAEGWHEQEYNPTTGRLWRWASERADLRVRAAGRAVILRMAGEIEAASESEVTVRVGDQILARHLIGRTFAFSSEVPGDLLAADDTAITIESSEWSVPAERRFFSWPDRRHLALKVFECELTAVR